VEGAEGITGYLGLKGNSGKLLNTRVSLDWLQKAKGTCRPQFLTFQVKFVYKGLF